jgi:hypothetical protein
VESKSAETWTYYETHDGLDSPPPNAITETSGECTVEEKYESMTDVVTPNYHARSMNGDIINSPMTKTTTITRDKLASYSWYKSFDIRDGHGHWNEQWYDYTSNVASSGLMDAVGISLPSHSYSTQSAIDYAVNKAYSNIDVSDVQALVMAAEGQKTVLSLVSIFTRFIKILKKIKRLDAKGLANELSGKELADRYMELRYALRPLMYDVRGCAAALKQTAGDKPQRLTFRGTKTDDDSEIITDSEQISAPAASLQWTYDRCWETEWSYDIAVRAGVLTAFEGRNPVSILGLAQPMESLWEIVPFSFIVDWFLNIGDTIAAWTPNYGLNTLSSWYVLREKYYRKRTMWYDNNVWWGTYGSNYRWNGGYTHSASDCLHDITVIKTTRVPNPRRSILPTINVKLDGFKLADLVIIAKKIWR